MRSAAIQRLDARLIRSVLYVLLLAFATAASLTADRTEHPATSALTLMTAVIIIGADGGLLVGLTAAAMACFIYNFFVRFPVYELGFSSIDDFLPLMAFTAAAAISGLLSGELKDRASAAENARARLDLVHRFSVKLQSAMQLDHVAEALRDIAPGRATHGRILTLLLQRNPRRWDDAWDAALARYPISAVQDGAALGLEEADVVAIADLLAMAIERCGLLDVKAEAESVRRSEALKTTLLTSLSHDIRTPLAAISTAATGLERYGEKLPPVERAQLYRTIEQQCQRLDRFTEKLLSWGRLQSGGHGLVNETVDIQDVLGGAIARARQLQQDRTIVKRFEPGALVKADPVMIEQVLFNVLENAVQYTPPQSPIAIDVRVQDDCVILSVMDEGPGIGAMELPYIFDRFVRSDSSAGKAGHGLGLSIAKAFTELFGGTIGARSPVCDGRGTEIRMTLPLANEALHG